MPPIRRAVRFTDLSGEHSFEVNALIDSGATFSQIPDDVAERMGLTTIKTERVRLGNGQVVEQRLCNAMVGLMGTPEMYATVVLAGEPGAPVVLGVHDLDSFGLGIDTKGERLIPKVADLLLNTGWPTI